MEKLRDLKDSGRAGGLSSFVAKNKSLFVDVQCNNRFCYFFSRMATLLSSRGPGSVELMEEPRQVL